MELDDVVALVLILAFGGVMLARLLTGGRGTERQAPVRRPVPRPPVEQPGSQASRQAAPPPLPEVLAVHPGPAAVTQGARSRLTLAAVRNGIVLAAILEPPRADDTD